MDNFNKSEYRVAKPLNHDGVKYGPGSKKPIIVLTKTEAIPLLGKVIFPMESNSIASVTASAEELAAKLQASLDAYSGLFTNLKEVESERDALKKELSDLKKELSEFKKKEKAGK